MSRPTKKCRSRVQKHLKDHFPEMSSVRPKVTTSNHSGRARHHFTYRKALRSTNGVRFQQIVHLTSDDDGKVLKVSVSR